MAIYAAFFKYFSNIHPIQSQMPIWLHMGWVLIWVEHLRMTIPVEGEGSILEVTTETID